MKKDKARRENKYGTREQDETKRDEMKIIAKTQERMSRN